ncbi:serine/threonine phosphatase [Leptolyngbya ohadii]|uniref:serine/threonine phosphatase n=1 Tax=Leptolyngbya ohadii TaxID=1962290 RepID=UPI000B59D53D|nr:serine/threonine phosphatase [Leptolyngbya ohadii]
MLICPHCSSENPDTHKFCQACGHLLTEQPCPGCGSLVPVQLERCPACQTFTGTIWYAICAVRAPKPARAESTTVSASEDAVGDRATPSMQSAILPQIGAYLDRQQRYRVLEILPGANPQEFIVRVLDGQPLQASPLQLLQRDRTPTEIIPYLELQADYHSLAMPDIHDAWEENGISVILLSDRTQLPMLSQAWEEATVLPLQILHWLHEMATLWALLEPHQACSSLLKPENLHVDEDQLLCLQRLYFDSADSNSSDFGSPDFDLPDDASDDLFGNFSGNLSSQSIEIKRLAELWQQMFQQSQRTHPAELALLQHELTLGKITSADALRTRIEAIAILLQTHDPMMSASDTTEPLDLPINAPAAETANLSPNLSLEDAALLHLGEDMTHPDAEDNTVPFSLAALNSFNGDAAWMEPMTAGEEGGEGDESPTIVLPMRLVSLEDAGRTDVGRQRDHNEDCFNICTEYRKVETPQGRSLEAKGLYILCDGMGGHAGGEVASALAVETLTQYFATHWQDKLPSEACIREGILQANRAIYALNQEDERSGSGRMGTTLVLVLIHNTEAAIAHVGDSRLYRFSRSRSLEQLTVDHEVGQREIQRGVEPAIAYARPDAYQLTQALGPRDGNFINPDVKFLELNEDLLLLLCSDGLSDNDLLERSWQTHLEPILRSQLSVEQGVNQLINLANERNGHDNVTALVIRAIVRPNVEMLGQTLDSIQRSQP